MGHFREVSLPDRTLLGSAVSAYLSLRNGLQRRARDLPDRAEVLESLDAVLAADVLMACFRLPFIVR